MEEWLSNKPFIKWLLNFASIVLAALILFWVTGYRDSKANISDKIQLLEQTKVDKPYVDNECKKLDDKINLKADLSLVESMDSKLDLILEKL